MFGQYQDNYQEEQQQPEIHPISVAYGNSRGVARLGLFVSGAMGAALISRLFDQLQPVYAIAAGTAICVWLGRLALLNDPDVRSRDLLIGMFILGGSALGWWDWATEQFAVLGGEKVWIQIAIVLGVVGLVVALRQSLKGRNSEGGYPNDYYQ
jgi:hypothetical protein